MISKPSKNKLEIIQGPSKQPKEEDTLNIAVYGTLRKGWGNHRLISHLPLLAKGRTVEKYAMYERGIPFVYKDIPEDRITVEVYTVNRKKDLPGLDMLENHPQWYRRQPINVEIENGEIISAELYFMQGSPDTHTNYVKGGDFSTTRTHNFNY